MRKKDRRKVVISLISLFVVVAVVLSVFQMTGLVNILGSDYGTGMTINTACVRKTINTPPSSNAIPPSPGNTMPNSKIIPNYNYITVENKRNHNDLGELLDSSRYVVSWAPGEYSKAITAQCDLTFTTRYDYLYWYLQSFPVTFVADYYWEVTYTDLTGKTTTIIDGKNFKGGPIGEPNNDASVKKDYVHIVRGYPRDIFPALVDTAVPNFESLPETFYSWADSPAATESYNMQTDTLVFEMKGNRIGSINVKCWVADTVYANEDKYPDRWYESTGPALLCEDKAYLASGRGEVRVDSLNAIKTAGADTSDVTDGTGIVYTKYVFAEGQDVTFAVDTGYSGTALESDQVGYTEGWRLDIVNNNGRTVKTIPIGDGLKNYKVTYTIPKGSFVSGGDNEWLVTLSNTLYDQSETRVFVVDTLDKIPGKSTATFDKNQYKQWETVKLSISAKPNPSGTNDIKNFRVWVTYDGWTSTNYALTARNVAATKSGDKYVATVTFQVSLGDKNLYATTVAVDSQGRAGPEGEDMAYVEQVIPTPPGEGNGTIPPEMGDYSIFIYGIIGVVIAIGVGYGIYYYYKRKKAVKR